MDFYAYQLKAQGTAIYPNEAKVTYPALGLAGEAGEVANQVKKIIRDDGGQLTTERANKIIDELGDCLWYIAAIASDLNISLDAVATGNLLKLAQRKASNELQGDARQA